MTQEQQPKFSQKEANSIVPFPESKIPRAGELETYLMDIIQAGKPWEYDKLPDAISAPAIDAYTDWLSDLTQADPEQRERGAFIHLDIEQPALVYPVNPAVGTGDMGFAEMGEGKRFLPLVRVHSHPVNNLFSPHDLKRVLGGKNFVAELLGTQGGSYLLLQTDQTKREDMDKTSIEMDRITAEIVEQFFYRLEFIARYIKQMGWPLQKTKKFITDLMEEEHLEFGSDSSTYLLTLANVVRVAEEYRIGLYKSDKNGMFVRFGWEEVESVKERSAEVVNRVLNRLTSLQGT